MGSGAPGWTVCWFFGVNFRPHALHRRILRSPRALVARAPLLAVSVLPHHGHLFGLPAGIAITSRDLGEAGVYKGTYSNVGDSRLRVELLELRGAGDGRGELRGRVRFMRQASGGSPGSVRGHRCETTVPLEEWCSVAPQEVGTVVFEWNSWTITVPGITKATRSAGTWFTRHADDQS